MTIAVPANISIARAKLPATYEQAKAALANCASIDECRDWANKAEALASYAKQADDDTLRKLADRIQARAVRRCGELLHKIKPQNGGDRGNAATGPRRPVGETRTQAAADAGLSERQRKTALRVANVPAAEFDAAVDSDAPPTVTKLAEMGKATRPVPEGFKQATHLLGAVRRFAEFCAANDPVVVAGGVMAAEIEEVRTQVASIDAWLDRFIVNLGE